MKRIALFVVLLVLMGEAVWAAGRAKIEAIARDPYVSALLLDADTGEVLFSENPEATVYPASVVKLMDLLVILERIEQGKNRLDEMVQVTPEAAKTGGSQVYLDPREQFSIEELLYALMVQSANDAAVALAIHVAGSKEGFVALMNQKAAELGMKNTMFHSVHGLPPAEGQLPDKTTAADLALLGRALLGRAEVLKFTGTKERGFRENKFIMRNHNHLLVQLDGCDGLKTGYFEAAGFSIAATAKRGGVRVLALVLGSKDRKVRDAKASELLAKGFTLVPPKPEAVQVAVKPVAPAEPEQPASAPGVIEEPAKEATSSVAGGSWRTFLLGIAAGAVLFALPLFIMLRRRTVHHRR